MEPQNRIQYYRKRAGLSQEELGERLYVSRQTVSQWETGQTMPSVDSLVRLRDIFGVSVDDILGLTPISESTDPATAAPEASTSSTPETYVFHYTEASLSYVTGDWRRRMLRRMILSLAVAGVLFAIMLVEPASGFACGFWGAIALVFVIQYRNGRRQMEANRPLMLARSYAYTVTDKGLIATMTDDHDPQMIIRRSLLDIKRVRTLEQYLLLETPDGTYVLDDGELPATSPIRTYLASRGAVAAAAVAMPSAKPKPPMALRVLSVVLFVASIASLVLGLALAGFVSQVILGDEMRFADSLWTLFCCLPIPVASIVLGIVMKRRGLAGKKNIVVGIVMCILLCIYGSFSVTMGDLDDPVTVVETELGLDLPEYEFYNSSTSAGLFGGDAVTTCTLRFTDTDGDALEALLDARDDCLSEMPADLRKLEPSSDGSTTFDRCILYDRTANRTNTIPSGPADMLALYYDDGYNTLTLVLYRWEA